MQNYFYILNISLFFLGKSKNDDWSDEDVEMHLLADEKPTAPISKGKKGKQNKKGIEC